MKKHRKKLRIESLEARRVLATYTVETLVDVVNASDGATSLREAIAFANQDSTADLIEFHPNLIGTIFLESTLTLGHLEISEPLTIRGNGRESTIVDGNTTLQLDSRRVFNVLPSAGDVTFENMTIQNGALSTFSGPQQGAGINFLSNGRLTIRNSDVTGNMTTGSAGGIHSVGEVWIEGANITNNYSRSRGNVRGGGIVVAGRVVALNSTIAGNEAFDTSPLTLTI